MVAADRFLMDRYAGLPYPFSEQWLDDVQWCGRKNVRERDARSRSMCLTGGISLTRERRHQMLAADFDSLIGAYSTQ